MNLLKIIVITAALFANTAHSKEINLDEEERNYFCNSIFQTYMFGFTDAYKGLKLTERDIKIIVAAGITKAKEYIVQYRLCKDAKFD